MLILATLHYASEVTFIKMDAQVVSTHTAIPYDHTPTLVHIFVFQMTFKKYIICLINLVS